MPGLFQLRGLDDPGPPSTLFNLTTEDGLSNLTTEDGLSVLQTSNVGALDFPGLPGGNNPVGFAAHPDFNSTNLALQPNGPGQLSAPVRIGDGTGGSFLLTSGTPTTPNEIRFKWFDAPDGTCNNINQTGSGGGSQPNVHDIKFIGCRFTANTLNTFAPDCCVQLYRDGSSNIEFSYCSCTPKPSVIATPTPGNHGWPSTSVGTGYTFVSTGSSGANFDPGNTYQGPYGVSFRDTFSISVPAGKFIKIDHCEAWGWGEGVGFSVSDFVTVPNTYPAGGDLIITENWIHDCRTDCGNNDHTNCIMCTNSLGMQNILCQHNTISGIGNTNAIGFQHLWATPGAEPNGVVGQGIWDSSIPYAFSSYYFFESQPSAGDKLGVNGTVFTYVASGATGNQINLGANLAATLTNTASALGASADAQAVKCTYTSPGGSRIAVFYKPTATPADGGSFTVAGYGGVTQFSFARGTGGYTNGSYTAVPTTGSSTGSGATFNLTVASVMTSCAINAAGTGYTVGDVLSNPFGPGTGFSVTVTSVAVGGAITGITFNPGSGYNNGTYTGIVLSGGTGSGATANLIVASIVTVCTLNARGVGYGLFDAITNSGTIGAGTGFSITISDDVIWTYGGQGAQLVRPQVGCLDGFEYRAIKSNTNVDPAGNLNSTTWQQFGVCSYRNIKILNNHISGFNNMIDLGTGNAGSTGIEFKNNTISNWVMWTSRICYDGGGHNGPNGVNFAGMFTNPTAAAAGNVWENNRYQMHPNSGAGGVYDTGNTGKNGFYLWPTAGGSLNAGDWNY